MKKKIISSELLRRKKLSVTELRRRKVERAMPEVRKIVNRFGLTVVGSCITKLREYDRALNKARKLAGEARKIRKNLPK